LLLKVAGVTPNANDLILAASNNDPYVVPPAGAQDFLIALALTYTGGGGVEVTTLDAVIRVARRRPWID
jgi:hypothetical protein